MKSHQLLFWMHCWSAAVEAWVAAPSATRQHSKSSVPFSTFHNQPGISPALLLHLSSSGENNEEPDEDASTPNQAPPSSGEEGFGDEEDDCGDECEIDWDAMPGWEDEEEEEESLAPQEQSRLQAAASASSTTSSALPKSSSAPPSVSKQRLRLEMQWQMTDAAEDCDIEQPDTCGSEPCQDCRGRGWNDCRFCHGTAVLRMRRPPPSPPLSRGVEPSRSSASSATMGDQALSLLSSTTTFSACPVCHQGVEVCRSCGGSGWVAEWTQLEEQKLRP